MAELPIVGGTYSLTDTWEAALPALFSKTFEEDDLVLVRPGLELRLGLWGNDQRVSAEQRVAWFAEAHPDRSDERREQEGGLLRVSWRTREEGEEWIEGFILADDGHVHVVALPEGEEAAALALAVIRGIRRSGGR